MIQPIVHDPLFLAQKSARPPRQMPPWPATCWRP